jgi:hypothetical protein
MLVALQINFRALASEQRTCDFRRQRPGGRLRNGFTGANLKEIRRDGNHQEGRQENRQAFDEEGRQEDDAPGDEEAVARPTASARTATVALLRTWHNTTRKAGACAGLFF